MSWLFGIASVLSNRIPGIYKMTDEDRRAPVQGDYTLLRGATGRQAGTISWEEHLRAWDAYYERWGSFQDAERIAERGGFGYSELVSLLGHAPETWRPV